MPSKLGVHGIMPGETPAIIQQLKASGARMTTVKAVIAMGWLADIKALDPETITVGRLMRGTDPRVNVEGPPMDGDRRKTAREVLDTLLPLWEPHRDYVDYWEIINEQDPTGVDGHRRLGDLMMHFMDIADAEGYKLSLFSYSLGVPEWEEMEALAEMGVFAKAKAGGHSLSLHEYAYPMNRWYGEPLPGRPTYPNRGPLACRYRWLYEDFLIPRDEVVPLFLTEVNIAKELPTVTANEWITQMKWYDTELRKDYYVIGAHLFTLGSAGSWEEFEFGRFIPNLVNYMVSVKGAQDPEWQDTPAPPTPPVPPPVDPPVTPPPDPPEDTLVPRVTYSRHYLLLPQSASWSWIAACRRYWETFKVTIGFSADDAAYGPGLEERAVTVINPSQWTDSIEAFFEAYYPGLRYDPVEAATPYELEAILNGRVARGQRFG